MGTVVWANADGETTQTIERPWAWMIKKKKKLKVP